VQPEDLLDITAVEVGSGTFNNTGAEVLVQTYQPDYTKVDSLIALFQPLRTSGMEAVSPRPDDSPQLLGLQRRRPRVLRRRRDRRS
jgi:hypothetical protein